MCIYLTLHLSIEDLRKDRAKMSSSHPIHPCSVLSPGRSILYSTTFIIGLEPFRNCYGSNYGLKSRLSVEYSQNRKGECVGPPAKERER